MKFTTIPGGRQGPPRSPGPPPKAPADESDLRSDFTHHGAAKRFVDLHGDKVRYNAGKWYLWDGQRWANDGNTISRIRALTIDVHNQLKQERASEEDEKARKELIRDTGRVSGQNAIMTAAESLLIPSTPFDGPDTDTFLNVQNGVLNLQNGELHSHSEHWVHELGFTTICPVNYDPGATCPRFDAFLSRANNDDAELIAYNLRVIGLWITGLSRKYFYLLAGVPDSGKTSFVGYVASVLGELYQKLSRAFFGRNAHQTYQADLHGKRLALCAELTKTTEVDSGLLKELTGNDGSTANRMHHDTQTARQTWSLVFSANRVGPGGLILDPQDDALWNRCALLWFANSIPDFEISDEKMQAIKREEAAGILNRCLQGLADYYARGQRLDPPEMIIEEKKQLRARCACAESDRWREAIADHIASFPGGFVERATDALGHERKGPLLSHSSINNEPCALTTNNCWRIIEHRTDSKVNPQDRKQSALTQVMHSLGLETRMTWLEDRKENIPVYAPPKGEAYVREREVRAKFLADAESYLAAVRGPYCEQLHQHYTGTSDLMMLLIEKLAELTVASKLRRLDSGLVAVIKKEAELRAQDVES
jgi:putative DNA primase/helicase